MTKNSSKAVSGQDSQTTRAVHLFSSLSQQMFTIFNPGLIQMKTALSMTLEKECKPHGVLSSIRLKYIKQWAHKWVILSPQK